MTISNCLYVPGWSFHEPTPHTAKTSAAIPYEYHPRISRRLVGVVSSPAYREGRCGTPSEAGD